MRGSGWRAGLCGLGLLGAIAAGPATAEPMPFAEARLVLVFGSLYALASPPIEAEPLAGVADVTRAGDGTLLGLGVAPSLFAASERFALDGVSLLPGAESVDVSFANGTGAFARTGTGTNERFAGTMPLLGIHKVCLFFACDDPSSTPVSVPLDVVGVGGITSQFVWLRVAIAGETWSTGSVTVDLDGGATSMVSGGLTPTSAGGTALQLVTPLMISTNAVGPDDEDVPPVRGYARLSLLLVPEPGAAGALGAAIAALVAAGFVRRRAA